MNSIFLNMFSGFTLTLQETRCIHDYMDILKTYIYILL